MPDETDLADAVLRYHYYKEAGIDPRHVAPYREEWLGNALAMVPARPPSHVSQVCADTGLGFCVCLRLASNCSSCMVVALGCTHLVHPPA
jgi:hypothetical protein